MLRVWNKEEGGGGGTGGDNKEQKPGDEQKPGQEQKPGDENQPPAEEEPEMEFFEPETPAGDDKKNVAPSYDFKKFKSVLETEEEIENEESFTKAAQKIRDENKALKILAQGRAVIDKDQEVLGYRKMLSGDDNRLALIGLYNDYLAAGKSEKEAERLATEELTEIQKEEGFEKKVGKLALGARKEINTLLTTREKALQKSIEDAQASVEIVPSDSKVVEKSRSEVSKINSFLGFKIPAATRDKVDKAVQSYIGSEQELKDLKDPRIRAEFAMYQVHKAQWEKNVKARGKGAKAEVIQGARKEPENKAGRQFSKPPKDTGQGNGRLMKNPSSFLKKQ